MTDDDDLEARIAAHVKAIMADAPPVTAEQRRRLASILFST